MSLFKRLFKIGQAEANAAIDKLEDPIKLTEQGIRDLKKDLEKSMQALAEVKAMTIRGRSDINKYNQAAQDYEKKAMLILQKAQSGDLDSTEADRLAGEALNKKEENVQNAERVKQEIATYEKSEAQLDANVKKLRANISSWENELRTLKARVKVSTATKNLNKQLSQVDPSGTVSMLEKMKDRVAEQESLSEAYGAMANESKSLDDELNAAIGSSSSTNSDALAELKKKMNLNK